MKKYGEVTQEAIIALRNNPYIAGNRNAYWDKELDKEVSELYYAGFGISSIAVMLSRTENSIIARIRELNLEKPVNKRHSKSIVTEEAYGNINTCDDCLCSECKNHDQCEKRPTIDQ